MRDLQLIRILLTRWVDRGLIEHHPKTWLPVLHVRMSVSLGGLTTCRAIPIVLHLVRAVPELVHRLDPTRVVVRVGKEMDVQHAGPWA